MQPVAYFKRLAKLESSASHAALYLTVKDLARLGSSASHAALYLIVKYLARLESSASHAALYLTVKDLPSLRALPSMQPCTSLCMLGQTRPESSAAHATP